MKISPSELLTGRQSPEDMHKEAERDFNAWAKEVMQARLNNLPSSWQIRLNTFTFWCIDTKTGLRVMFGGNTERDGKKWLHVSYSFANRLPSWEDTGRVKKLFLGEEALALIILPPAKEYINHHKFTLHLWECLDGRPTPDFRRHLPNGRFMI